MTCSTRIEYVLHTNITLPDGSCYNLRHVFERLSDAHDLVAWFKRQGCSYVTITQVQLSEIFKPVDLP